LNFLLFCVSLVSPLPAIIFLTVTHSPSISTLSLHDALPISAVHAGELFSVSVGNGEALRRSARGARQLHRDREELRHFRLRQKRSEEHTSELQSRVDLVCRLLLEKKNYTNSDCGL